MQTECISGQLEFEGFYGRRVVAAFDGGAVTSDAGALLLRETDRAIRLIEWVAACFRQSYDDPRFAGPEQHFLRACRSRWNVSMTHEDVRVL